MKKVLLIVIMCVLMLVGCNKTEVNENKNIPTGEKGKVIDVLCKGEYESGIKNEDTITIKEMKSDVECIVNFAKNEEPGGDSDLEDENKDDAKEPEDNSGGSSKEPDNTQGQDNSSMQEGGNYNEQTNNPKTGEDRLSITLWIITAIISPIIAFIVYKYFIKKEKHV